MIKHKKHIYYLHQIIHINIISHSKDIQKKGRFTLKGEERANGGGKLNVVSAKILRIVASNPALNVSGAQTLPFLGHIVLKSVIFVYFSLFFVFFLILILILALFLTFLSFCFTKLQTRPLLWGFISPPKTYDIYARGGVPLPLLYIYIFQNNLVYR